MKRRGLLGAAAGLALAQGVAAQSLTPTLGPLVLENTAEHRLTAAGSGRVYPLWIALPSGFDPAADPARKLPVVVAADAPWSFGYLRTIRHFVGRGGRNIEDFLLVGLAPDTGSSHVAYRARDYTPSNPLARPAAKGDDYSAAEYGQSAAYLRFVLEEALPQLATRYPLDASRQVFIGHSYGALLGLQALLTRPQAFTHYILGSPSLWFDRRVTFETERRGAAARRDLPARVAMFAGGFETLGDTPRHYKASDLVGDMRAFARQLQARRYPGLQVQASVIADEDHFTVFPSLAARGLTWALPGRGPYLSG